MIDEMPSPCQIRVVHVVGQLEMGGMEKLLVEFARHADRSRFELTFLSLGKRGVIAEEIEALGWPVDVFEIPPGLHPRAVLRLASRFRKMDVDVVHTHNTRTLLYSAPAVLLAGVPRLIHTRHGQRFGASKRETTAFRLASMAVNRFVCVSHDSEVISKREGISPKIIRTILNGIDVSRFRPLKTNDRGPIVSVGRMSPEKDVANLVKAAAIAVRSDETFRLDIAGDGVCFDAVRQQVSDLKLEQSVKLLGQVRDIPNLLNRASVFTLASMTEGISLTIMEAMAAGLPVVATRVGGNPEVVADGITGLLMPPGNPEALAAALLELWRSPESRKAMGSAGRARVETRFDVRRMVEKYESLYSDRRP